MPEMDAVVRTDRDGAPAVACTQVPESTNEPHERTVGAAAKMPRGKYSVDNPPTGPQTTAPLSATPPETFVANTKSAEKAARQAEKHRTRNVALRSRMRTAVRNVTAAVAAGNKAAAEASYRAAVPVIDALVNKQIIHRNKAARHKSHLAARVRAMQ